VRALIDRIRRSAGKFFDAGAALACGGEGAVRIRCIPDLDQALAPQVPFDANTPMHRLKRQVFRNGAFVECPDAHDEELLRYAKDALRQHLAEAATRMQEMAATLRQAMEGELTMYGDQALGLESCASRLREFVADLDFVTAATEPEYVFWAQPGGRRNSRVSFVGAPLSIAATLNETLFKNKDSCVFCSATLRVGGSFRYINRRMGFDLVEPARFMESVAESPFDYIRQCAVFATEFMPEPAGEGSLSYVDTLSSLMAELFAATEGRALGLFTSYDMMNRVAGLLEEPLRESGIRLLVHGKSGTRDQITRIFREGRRCALLGTHSFWEGVDVTGEALSCVVMARLPFAAVGDPVVEARCEQIQLAGGNAFRDFTLPQAVIRFRQGFGRLIRTEEDRGVVVVADPRIVSRAYGSSFIRSLPCPVAGKRSPEELLAGVKAFFDQPEISS
jgi:ATP-dependent DNA helicase DinG